MSWFDYEDSELAEERRRREFAERVRQAALETKRKAEDESMRAWKRAQEPKRTITGEPVSGPGATFAESVPLATRRAAEKQGAPRYPWGIGAPSLEEWRGLPRAIGETAALERGAPSWAQRAYEETALATVAGGPTAFGFSAEALPVLEPLGYGLMKLGPAGRALEALPGRAATGVGEVVRAAVPAAQARFRALAEEAAPGITRLATGERGGVGLGGGLTPEAESLLKIVDEGGVPAFISERMKQVARENGVEVTAKMTPNDVIEALRAKRVTPTGEPIPRVTPPEAAAPEPLLRLTNDVPDLADINPRITQLRESLAKPRVKGRTTLERELARLEAQRDVARLTQPVSVEVAETNLGSLEAELRQVEVELSARTRGQALREMPPAQAPQFGTQERADWLAERAGRAKYARPTTGYEQQSTLWLEERRGVLTEFLDNAKFEPVAPKEAPVAGARAYGKESEVMRGTLFWGPERTGATEGQFGTAIEQGMMIPETPEAGLVGGETPVEKFRRLTLEGHGEAPPPTRGFPEMEQPPGFRQGAPTPAAGRVLTPEDARLRSTIATNEGEGVAAGSEAFWARDIGTVEAHRTADQVSIRLSGLSDEQVRRLQVMDANGEIDLIHKPDFPLGGYTEVRLPVSGWSEQEVGDAFKAIADDLTTPRFTGRPITGETPTTPAAGEGVAPPPGARSPSAGGQAEESILQSLQREETRIGRPSGATPEYAQRQAAASGGGKPPRGTVPPVDATVPNPEAAPRSMQSQVHEANWRLRLTLNSADSRDTAIGERLMAGQRQLFKFTPDKRLANVTHRITGEHPFWNDAFQRPNDYIWPSTEAREYRDTIAAIVKAKSAELRVAGVPFREATLAPGEDWMPRAVEEIRGEAVRGVKRAVGAKQAFQLPRWHEFVESGVANGVDYAMPAPTIETFLKAADTAIAHGEYRGIINRFGATGAERIGAEPKQAVIDAFRIRNAARAEVNRLQRAFLRATGDREAKVALREQIADAKVTLADSQTALNQARSGKARLMEFARRPRGPQEAYLPEPFAAGRIFPREVVQQVEHGLKPPENAVTSVLKAARDVNNVIRPIWAGGDMSYTALQTAPALGMNPGAWAKMQAVILSSLADPTNYYTYVERNAATIDRMIARGRVPWYGSDVLFDPALQGPVGKWVRKGLTVAKPLKIGNDLFGRSLNVTGVELWKQGEAMIAEVGEGAFSKILASRFGPVAKGADAYEQLGSVIAHGTGRLSLQEMAKMGPLTDLVVGALPFAGRYWASWGLLLTDAVRGGMRGNLARRLVAGWAATGVGIYSLISYALGQEPNLDPRDGSKLLTVAIKGGRYGMGGTLHGFLLLAGRIADNPDQTPQTLARYARSKSGPVASLATDLITRETYMGEPLDTWTQRLNYLKERSGPFAVQSLVRGEGIPQAAATFTGLRAFPQSPYEQLTQMVSGWDKMTNGQRQEAADADPEVAKLWKQQIGQAAGRGQEWAQTKEQRQQEAVDFQGQVVAALGKPGITRADVTNAISDFLQKRANQDEIRYAGVKFTANTPDKKLLDAYYNITMPDIPTATDRQTFYDEQDAMLAANPRLRVLIKQNHQAIFSDPTVKRIMAQIDAARDVRKQYYAISTKLGMPAADQQAARDAVTQATAQAQLSGLSVKVVLAQMGLPSNVYMKALIYLRLPDNPARKRFRLAHANELSWFEAIPVSGELVAA